ncbi:mannose receptor c type 1 [Plakobranchus ocellatus]|uniref:Mannose receptor c type 1 n=1 Tax=Plakobranchus ocellatus TaxID=259542 RepID=A0AAV3ZTQ3_9GAST|nr:mannose receptor c type 1 [Plakobranchus ocellatus]
MKRCVDIWAAKWYYSYCLSIKHYICERPILKSAVGQCPAKWSRNPSTGTCIQMGGQPKRWQAARAECMKRDGGLVTIVDDNMNNFVNDIRNKSSEKISWIGLNRLGSGGNFSWSNGNKPVKYSNWAAISSGINSKVKNCVATGVNGAGEWAALKCSERRDFICERQPVCPLVDGVCSPGWVKSPDSCIKFYDQDRTWEDAREVCIKDSADLVTVLDSCMSKTIEEQLKSKTGAYWIGLNDQLKEGLWRWLDDTNMINYTNWAPGQPNNYSYQESGHERGQDCVEVGKHKNGQWNDHVCTAARKFICEQPAMSPNPQIEVGYLVGIVIFAILVLCGAIIAAMFFGRKLYRGVRAKMGKIVTDSVGVTNAVAKGDFDREKMEKNMNSAMGDTNVVTQSVQKA